VLVMKPLRITFCAAFAFLAANNIAVADKNTRETDAGAGPIRVHVTDCLIANRTHQGAPCPKPPLSQSGDKAQQVASHLDRAWYFVDMQELEQARAEADAALDADPNDLKARHLSARLSLTLGDLPRAQTDLEQARKQAPDDPDIHTTYAIFLQSKPADLQSLRELQAVILRHPSHFYAREQASDLLMRFGQYDVALANLNFIIERMPSTSLLVKRAEAFLALGSFQSAVADLSDAIKREPNDINLIVARAEAYAHADLDEFALRDYDAVLATDHDKPVYPLSNEDRAGILQKRAFSFVRLRRFDDAASDMISSVSMGGTGAILRMQVLLRRHGFSDVPVDGHESAALRKALVACFGINACFQGVMQAT
jgi:Tfp pilus assembly protein PilF